MSESDQQQANGAAAASDKPAQPPRLSIQSQFIKDLSFENPNPLRQATTPDLRPEIQIKVDVRAREIEAERYEIELQLNVDALIDKPAGGGDSPVDTAGEKEAVFKLELLYGGVFVVANIPKDSLQPLVMIECPRLLFPFARRVVADMTRDGGFPPLMIDPIDFVALFRRRAQAAAQAAKAEAEEKA